MRRLVTALAAVSAFAFAAPAMAASTITLTPTNPLYGFPTPGPFGQAAFTISPSTVPYMGVGEVTAGFSHTGIPMGTFQDFYKFTLGQDGFGSGTIGTSLNLTAMFEGPLDTDIFSILFNGTAADSTLYLRDGTTICTVRGVNGCGAVESFSLTNATIYAGVLNTIEINGQSRGNGSYGGQATFTPGAVPEPATWAMMLLGFGAVGFSMRRSKRNQLALQVA